MTLVCDTTLFKRGLYSDRSVAGRREVITWALHTNHTITHKFEI